MFSVSAKMQDGFDMIELKDNGSGTCVEVIPSCGALLHSFSVMHQGKSINVIDSYQNKLSFDTQMEELGFKSAKLSPFVCRMKNGAYSFEGKTHVVEGFYLGAHAIHGLVYKAQFDISLIQENEHSAVLELVHHYDATDAGFPFKYSCQVQYELSEKNGLTITTTIKNNAGSDMPICDGWHPYFGFGGAIDDCELAFKSKEIVEFDTDLIPTGKLIPYKEYYSLKKIGNSFLDNCFTANLDEAGATLVLRDPQQGLQLEISPEGSYPFLQIYTPPHRQSIAIENLSAAPDAFNNKMGLIVLTAGEEKTFRTLYAICAK
jgi:aldose 1-epimerase